MAGRLPFNLQGHPGQNALHDAQIRAALGLSQVDEALYLQQQRELQRDFQLRQMLLQDQLSQQSRLDSIVAEQQLRELQEFPELQQHYSQLLLRGRLHRDQEADSLFARAQLQQHQDEYQRRTMGQSQAQAAQPAVEANKHNGSADEEQNAEKSATNVQAASHSTLRDLAADSLAGNAVKRSDLEKRVYAKPDDDVNPVKKRSRSGTEDSGELDKKRKKKKDKLGKKESTALMPQTEARRSLGDPGRELKAQDLIDFATSTDPAPETTMNFPEQPSPTLGTLGDLINAAESDRKTDSAISVLKDIKERVVWSDSEDETDHEDLEQEKALKKGDAIVLPNFSSILPQLPEEPEVVFATPSKKSRKKHKGLLDDDSVDLKSSSKSRSEKGERKDTSGQSKSIDAIVPDYPYPLDTWWPSISNIRRERRANNEVQDEDDFEEDEEIVENSQFRMNVSKIRERFANEVAPGVLEKLPHCRIHRKLMKKRKNSSAPEFVYCFQVTELYPNDIMVCCSICGTWRHTCCGGHYKPYSVREGIDTPFTAVCDRCHVEEKMLSENPIARRRIDRQRSEQIRRGLSTSAAMRQASFSKHGGTYKWPLGSVSATHIGGHTRSVHHRHDKAEKQWMDMAQRLSRSNGYRPKERIKSRTKELERLLVSVEDAEGHTDRHNMMLFLLQDTLREHPCGFEKRRQNIFDPEEDNVSVDDASEPHIDKQSEVVENLSCIPVTPHRRAASNKETSQNGVSTVETQEEENGSEGKATTICIRKGCSQKPRFDSVFCSDSCGVASLEADLLRTFQYTSDIHPSMFRH